MRSKLFMSTMAYFCSFAVVEAKTVESIPVSEDLLVRVSDHEGKTYFNLMTEEGGVRDLMNEAFRHPYSLLDPETIKGFEGKFSSKVWRNLYDPETLEPLLADLEGVETTNKELGRRFASKKYDVPRPYVPAMFLSLVGGASVLVHLNEETYFYNVGYDDGGFATAADAKSAATDKIRKKLKLEPNEKIPPGTKIPEPVGINSGRSYAAGPSHPADDASYPDYLKNMRAYYKTWKDLRAFTKAVLLLLTRNDISALNLLDNKPLEVELVGFKSPITIDGQSLVADFMAVYTAELYRNLFAEQKAHDWQNALAEMTFISQYSDIAGIYQSVDGEILEGTPSNWRYVGTQGSGIGGKAGMNRRAFQVKVCDAARSLKFQSLIPVDAFTEVVFPAKKSASSRKVVPQNRDCFKSVFKALNDAKKQAVISEHAEALSADFAEFLHELRTRHEEITAIIAPEFVAD